jgi:glycosyltransferase involved in cell wall biosynthesis
MIPGSSRYDCTNEHAANSSRRDMRILIVSGIWPPEVGGPASHGPEFGKFLVDCGHEVSAVTTTRKAGATDPGFPLTTCRIDRGLLVRLPSGAIKVLAAARGADVIYSTGMYARSALASAVHRVPLVVKLVNDPAYDRARSIGAFSGTLDEFQGPLTQSSVRALKRLRQATLARASRVVIPSRFFADIASGWGVPTERISVVPNPAPPADHRTPRDELRERLGLRFPTFVFVGRLVEVKNLPLAIAAVRDVVAASLVVIGDGPEYHVLADAIAESDLAERVSLKGALPRDEAIEWLRAADAAILSSEFENFPHAAVEALSVGTPVIATSVGGVPEIIEEGVNGLLVSPGDPQAFAAAMATLVEDRPLLERLREGARATGASYAVEPVFESLERELVTAALSH